MRKQRFFSMTAGLLLSLLAHTTTAHAVEVGKPAPPFSLRTMQGIEKKLSDYRGKVVVIEFFTSWCHVCAASIPKLNDLQKDYPDQIAVIGISTAEDDPHGLEAFIKDNRPEFTILVDSRDTVGRKYRALMFPSFFIIDPDGIVAAQQRGPVKWENPKVRAVLENLFPTPATSP